MKKALRIMQEMQAFLAERGIDAHVDRRSRRSFSPGGSSSIFKPGTGV